MPELNLTREEIRELVGVISSEVARQMGGRQDIPPVERPPAAHFHREGEACECELCPHHAPPELADACSVHPTPDVCRLARLIDHTVLRPDATSAQIEKLCEEAKLLGFGAVCINPAWVPLAAERLRETGVKVATVVGFPFGATLTSAKRAEAEAAIVAGAEELDMVMNVGAMRSGDCERVAGDIRGVVEAARASGALVKVILENAFLSDEQKAEACRIAQREGADYVKTSTGFGPSGSTEADVRLMRKTVGPAMGVKAAGGIRTLADMLRMLTAGATRIGASASVAILAEASRRVS